MRVLVTGGAGYIGSHCVRHLVSQGHQVTVVDNFSAGHREAIVDPEVELVVADIGDEAKMTEVFTRFEPEAVIHFAAFAYVGVSVQEPLKYYQNNIAAPITLLRVIQQSTCRRFVFSSTCATYGEPSQLPIDESEAQEPINPYGRSKLMLEKILSDCEAAWGLCSVCLRYFNASGASSDGQIGENHNPETHLIPRVLMAIQGQIPVIDVFGTDYPTPDGTCIRDYIHVEDLATAHIAALGYLEQGGKSDVFNLGTGQGYSVKEILKVSENVTGHTVPVSYGERRIGDPPELVANPAKAHQVLQWQAMQSDLETIIATAWKWQERLAGPCP